MSVVGRHRVLVFSVACLLGAPTPALAADCEAIHKQATEASERGELGRLQVLYREAVDCDAAFRRALGRRVARLMVNQVREQVRQGGAPNAEAPLKESLSYGRLWQALAMLGDVYHDRKAYEEATRHYQEALEEIQDTDSTPEPPPAEVIRGIFKKAEQTRLLAEQYVSVVNRASGAPGGLAAPNIRGFVPVAVGIPVTFKTGGTEFSAKGAAAAADLARVLKIEKPPGITLIGHSDPVGGDQQNLELSRRRAEAVRRYLVANGYGGRIRVEGRGKREPLEVDDPGRYSREELYQMYRRVEFRRE